MVNAKDNQTNQENSSRSMDQDYSSSSSYSSSGGNNNNKPWGLILGGSTGIGLATAKKLASDGLSLVVVHRDRRGSMQRIEAGFDEIRAVASSNKGNQRLHTINADALSSMGRQEIISQIADTIGDGEISLLLHSIALGNLKLLVPEATNINSEEEGESGSGLLAALAGGLGVETSLLQSKIDQLFADGCNRLVDLATPPTYSSDLIAAEEDIAQTVYNMGTSLLFWVQDIHRRGMFAADSRVLGLTSEGNDLAWKSYGAVSAAKCALESIARSIASEFAPHGIRCNILQPGVTDTPALRLIPGSLQMKARAVLKNPFQRLTTPEDIANVVSLMARPEASWINGTIIRVDGGEHISGS